MTPNSLDGTCDTSRSGQSGGEAGPYCLDIEIDEIEGSVRVYDPRVFHAGRRPFCRRLIEAMARSAWGSKGGGRPGVDLMPDRLRTGAGYVPGHGRRVRGVGSRGRLGLPACGPWILAASLTRLVGSDRLPARRRRLSLGNPAGQARSNSPPSSEARGRFGPARSARRLAGRSRGRSGVPCVVLVSHHRRRLPSR